MDEANTEYRPSDQESPVDAGSHSHVTVTAEPPRVRRTFRRSSVSLSGDQAVRSLPAVLVGLSALAYAFYFSRLTIRHHNGFGTAGFDIGLYDQGLWLLSQFRSPFVTVMGRNLFGDHSSFILLPLVPFYWFGAGSSFLLAAQSVALGSTAIPVYLTVRRVLDSRWAACGLAVAFLLQPSLAWTNSENFHPDAFVAPLLMTAIWAMVARRWRVFLVFGILSTLVKEDTLLVIIPLGIYAWWRFGRPDESLLVGSDDGRGTVAPDDSNGATANARRPPRNRAGLVLAGWSLLWTGFALVLLRTLNSVGSLNSWRIPFGGPTGVIKTAFRQPDALWDYLVKGIDYPGDPSDNRRMWYLWKIFTPVMFLALRAPLECMLFILVIGLNIISNFFYQYNIEYHYTVIILPGLFFATTMAISRLRRVAWTRLAVVGVAASCLWTGYLWGPSPLSARPSPWSTSRAPWVAEGRALLAQVPPDVPISVFYGYVPHIGHRVEVYQFPVPWRDSYYRLPGDETAQIRPLRDRIQWVITRDVETSPDPTVRAAYNEMIADFELVDQQGTGRLFRRRGLGGGAPLTTVAPVPINPGGAAPTSAPVSTVVPLVVVPPPPVPVASTVDSAGVPAGPTFTSTPDPGQIASSSIAPGNGAGVGAATTPTLP